jgi:type VI secretion system protein ImpJ
VDDITLVHWHEGLFLKPHHLQHLQRGLLARLDAERAMRFAHPYGVVETLISDDALDNFQVRVDKLVAVMPSGLVVRHPDDAEIPVLDFKKAFEESGGKLEIRLGVPVSRPHGANVVDDLNETAPHRHMRRQRVALRDLVDENTGEGASKEVVRRVNARLVIEGEPTEDMETIPLARLVLGVGEGGGLPKQDPRFIPPSLVLAGSGRLTRLVRDLAQQIEASRADLAAQMAAAGMEIDNLQGRQIEQFFRLRTLARFAVRLSAIAQYARAAAPFEAYSELVECLAELRALSPGRDEQMVPEYKHDALGALFLDLDQRIRGLLPGQVAERFIKYDFKKEQDQYQVELPAEAFARGVVWYLGVQTNQDAREVNEVVENKDNFRILPPSLARRLIWGVPLEYDRVGSPHLPGRAGLHFYKLDVTDRKWEAIKSASAAVANFAEAGDSDWRLAIYATVP